MIRASLLCAALAAASAVLPAAAATPASDEDPAVAGVVATLERLEARAAALRRDVAAARLKTDAAPPSFAGRVADLQARRAALVPLLYGRQWTDVQPVVERVDRLGTRLSDIGRSLSDWPSRSPAPVAPAGSGTAVIRGLLRDARTGAPIVDGRVEIHDADGDYAGGSWTDANGAYEVGDLAAGTYFANTSTWDHLDELYDDIICDPGCVYTSGTPIPLADGQTRTGIDFVLQPLGAIEGTILDAAQSPIESAIVSIYDSQGYWEEDAISGPDGRYRVERLRPGVYFAVASSAYYLDELHANIPCEPDCDPETGTSILVGVATTVTGIDFALDLGGSISGRVTDQVSGQPLSATYVDVYDGAGHPAGSMRTDATGAFRVFDLPAGTYYARTTFASDHMDELWDDIPCDPSCTPTLGTPIAVAQSQERTGIDFALRRLGSLSGRVTDADQGSPLDDVAVRAVNAQGGFEASGGTDASGRYRVGGLRAGTYFVFTSSDSHLDELYDNLPCDPTCTPTAGNPVQVALDAETAGIDFALRRGGWITGRVVAQSTQGPIENATVQVYRANGGSVGSFYTDGSGGYTAQGLAAGNYYAIARSWDYASELYRERPCPQGCNPLSGDPIAVAVAQGTGGIDFTLMRLGRVTGQVKEQNGLPVATRVSVYDATGIEVASAPTGGTGGYLVEGLAAGSYHVATRTGSFGPNVVDELYDNRVCEPTCDVTAGTPVVVALDATTSGINFTLRRPVFADVPVDHFAWKASEAVYNAGVTTGCATAPLRFCPDANVSRAQMSVFLLKAKEGPAYVPPPAQGLFQDVPASDPFARWIEELANRGIATGCATNPPRFCPANPTTRAQMAPLLLVTREGTGYTPPPAIGVFQDVPASDPFARWIEELVRRGVTGGCSVNPPLYCPGQATTRAQMAVFLTATFGLPLP